MPLLAESIEAGCKVEADAAALVVRSAAKVPEALPAALSQAKATILELLSPAHEARGPAAAG
jgi:hypothetical protein